MATPLTNSVFSELLTRKHQPSSAPQSIMGGISLSDFPPFTILESVPIVIFDFETTGLDTRRSRIIEIGAIKFFNRKEVERYSCLVDPGIPISKEITAITGITPQMLVGQPRIEDALPKFHAMLRGSIGSAHNAEFDCSLLAHESARIGMNCSYWVLCTLKMARQLVKCERRGLDALAAHYGLEFQARHRSIGDILVTADVLWRMLDENTHLKQLKDFIPYQEQACWQTVPGTKN